MEISTTVGILVKAATLTIFREYLANTFKDECLADEILSFSVDMECNFNDFENFAPYPFMISFPGLVLRLTGINWKTQLVECFSIRFICNLNVVWMNLGDEGAIAIAEALETNFTLQKIDLQGNQIGPEGAIVIAESLKKKFYSSNN